MGLFEKILLVVIAAALGFAAAWYWNRKGRVVKKEDDEDSESKQERKGLAAELEATRQERADKLEGQAERTQDRLAGIDAELASLKAHAAPLNAAFAAILVKELTNYHTPEMDALLAKLDLESPIPNPTLTEDDEARLLAGMVQRTKDLGPQISDNQRDAAEMLPFQLRRLKREAQRIAAGESFVSVAVVGILNEGEE